MTKDATQVAQLKVASDRCYHGLHYIEGAPFRIPFWTIATNIDPMEGVRRLRFADELVAAWNTRIAAATLTAQIEALTAERDALREALARIANRINIEGSPWHEASLALDRVVSEVKREARAALASTSEGDG